MSQVIISGNTSGSCTLTAPDVAGASVLTLPVATDTLVGKATTDVLTNKTLTSPTIAGAVVSAMGSSVLTSGTAVASTSGTSIDFTGIPSWAKRITVMFSGVSLSGTSSFLVQLGSGSPQITGYQGTGGAISTTASNTTGGIVSTAGIPINVVVAAYTVSGAMTLVNISGNTWISFYALGGSNDARSGGGNVTLSGALDRVRITTVNGTDTFDAGSINIMYE
jgi:hypothetical protein